MEIPNQIMKQTITERDKHAQKSILIKIMAFGGLQGFKLHEQILLFENIFNYSLKFP